MKKSLAALSILSFMVVATDGFCRGNEVVVDMSVLGEVGGSSPVYSPSVATPRYEVAPLGQGPVTSVISLPNVDPKFPVVKSKPKIVRKAVKKPIVKKAPEVKAPVEDVVKIEDKVEISRVTIEEPKREGAPVVESATVEAATKETPPASEPVKMVEEKITETITVEVPAADVLEEPKTVVETPVVTEQAPVSGPSAPVDIDPIAETAPAAEVVPAVAAESSSVEANTAPISENVVAPSNLIVFEKDVTELNEGQKIQLLRLVETFEDPARNRISIVSYNHDDGDDVFKNKRLSLNRATEVRHFLISQGYKNYNIKVVSVEKMSDKLNSVEVSEVK